MINIEQVTCTHSFEYKGCHDLYYNKGFHLGRKEMHIVHCVACGKEMKSESKNSVMLYVNT